MFDTGAPIIWKLNEDSWEENVVDLIDILNPDIDFLRIDAGDIDGDGANEIAIALSYDDNILCIFKYDGDTYTLITSISSDGQKKVFQ